MERFNFQEIEKKWQKNFSVKIFIIKGLKNFIVRNVSLSHLEKFIWVMLEIIQLGM